MKTLDFTHASNSDQDGVYYRLYQPNDGYITVVTLQYFDECDYHDHKFVKNSDGERYWFEDEDDAIAQLNEWYEQDQIDPEFRRSKLLIR